MASKLAVERVIGAAVKPTVGAVFNTLEDRIKQVQQEGNQPQALKNAIGDVIRLDEAVRAAQRSGSSAASALQSSLDKARNSLRSQGVDVRKLREQYQALGRALEGSELQAKGRQQFADGKAGLGRAVTGFKAIAIPAMISADFQSIVRDIAIKAGVAGEPQEKQMARSFISTSQTTGMARNDVANMVRNLVDGGMKADTALAYAPLAAKFAVGQGASGADTASIINALQANAKITDPKVMESALEMIAAQTKAGGFAAPDLATSLAPLLEKMGGLGSTGLSAVSQVGAMLQVQRRATGSSDQAASNLGSWLSSLASAQISKEADPQKAQAQFDVPEQISAALMAFAPNQALYTQYRDIAPKAKGGLDNDLLARRETSVQIWNEAYQAIDESMRSMGDAVRPLTDNTAKVITFVAQAFTTLTDKAQPLVLGIAAVGAAISAVTAVAGVVQMGRGGLNVGRGLFKEATAKDQPGAKPGKVSRLMNIGLKVLGFGGEDSPQGAGMGTEPLQVFVVNAGDFTGGGAGPGSPGGRRTSRRRQGNTRNARRNASSVRTAPAPASTPGGGGGVARLASGASKFGGLLKRVPGGNLIGAGLGVVDTYRNARTVEAKAEGYGAAAGGFGGALAGAAAGAALGSVVPVLGTAVGGVIGAMVGGMGGEDLGGWLGKRLFGSDDPGKTSAQPTENLQLGASGPGDVVRSLAVQPATPPGMASLAAANAPDRGPSPQINQQFTFAPNMPFTVQGGLSDPLQLAQEVGAIVRREFDGLVSQATSRQLYDAPHVV
ncbi:phage tail tape measure protein [Pseudomonas sp. UM16]|uniref:phage tail tape measure protein n=1 Tax=Pseudomonas sp. UM16 TaxID=3158962 RepID=UPI00398FF2A2